MFAISGIIKVSIKFVFINTKYEPVITAELHCLHDDSTVVGIIGISWKILVLSPLGFSVLKDQDLKILFT